MRCAVAKRKKKLTPATELQIGDIVQLIALPDYVGKVVEYRGPIGHGGRVLYRIRFGKSRRNSAQIEVPANQTVVIRTVSDAQGRVNLELPFAGAWMLSAVHMIPVSGVPDVDWDSFWSSLSFELADRLR